MPTLGSAGKNSNWAAPSWTVPGTMTLDGSVSGTLSGVKIIHSLDVRRAIPQAKFAAVLTAVAARGAKIKLTYGGWPMSGGAARGFRLFLTHPGRAGNAAPWNGANVTLLLGDIETAITT